MPTLDFSQFHPLDHSSFNPVCARYAGGFLRHWYLFLSYKWEPPWEKVWHTWRCRNHHHDIVPYWKGMPEVDATGAPTTPPAGHVCRWCDERYE